MTSSLPMTLPLILTLTLTLTPTLTALRRYAWDAIAEWQARQDEPLRMLLGAEPRLQPRSARDGTGSLRTTYRTGSG